MAWTKIDDQFHCHPKVIAAGTDGVALFILGLSWCGGSLTNGFIPESQVRRLSLSDNSSAIAARLVEVGLWERRDGGYQIHDYLDYNPSRTKIKATRQARAEAGHIGGLRSGEAKRKQAKEEAEANGKHTPSKTEAKMKAKANPVPVPVPVPAPTPDSPKHGPPLAGADAAPPPPPPEEPKPKRKKTPTPEAVRVFRENAHRYPPKAWYAKIAEVVGDDPEDLEFWGQVVLAYVGLGWNPGNVKNMLDFHERREVPTTGGKGKNVDALSSSDEWFARRQEAEMGGIA